MITIKDLPDYSQIYDSPQESTATNIDISALIFMTNFGLKPMDYLSLNNSTRLNLNKAVLDYLEKTQS